MSITLNIANTRLPPSQQNNAATGEELQKQNNAATKIQKKFREHQQFQKQNNAATKIQTAQRVKVAREELQQQKLKKRKTYNTIFERIRQESEEEKKKQKERYKEYRKEEFFNDFEISENLNYKAFDGLNMSVFENPETFNKKISERIKNIGKIIKSNAVEKKRENINQTIEIDVKNMLDIIGIKIPQDEKVVFEIKSQELIKTTIVIVRNAAATKIQSVQKGHIARGQLGVRRQEFQQRQQQNNAATKIQRAQRAKSQPHINTIDVNLFEGGKTTRKKKSKKNKTRKKK